MSLMAVHTARIKLADGSEHDAIVEDVTRIAAFFGPGGQPVIVQPEDYEPEGEEG